MCGISGLFCRGEAPVSESRLLAMRADQVHRGPDDAGMHVGPHIGLAFNRLAVIDLSPAAGQPMAAEGGRVWIVFNGEIYNFQDLRRELESKGRTFRTRSDTEVILQGYLEWGTDIVGRMNGMFALALWDADREALHLVRDRVGKKPLFYRDHGGEVVFASEVRALLKGIATTPDVDPEMLDSYLAYMCVPGDRSIFSGIRKVPPASIATFTRTGCRIDRFWSLSYRSKPRRSEVEVQERLDALLTDATRVRMISDVPVGAFLSGGVDSSTVVALMARQAGAVKTFSVGFSEESFNELPHARKVASVWGTQHEEIHVEPDASAILPRLVWHYGEPFADSSAVPTYYVAEAARRRVTVALNGDGGDEGFGGYPWHRAIRVASLYRSVAPARLRRFLDPLGRSVADSPRAPGFLRAASSLVGHWGGRTPVDSFWIWPGFREPDRPALYTSAFLSRLRDFKPTDYARRIYRGASGLDDVDCALEAGIETYLPDDLLVKVDVATMAHSLEARSPLLDYRVLEFAASLPPGRHVGLMSTKRLLKAYAARLIPPSVVYRRKQGFSIPLAAWLRGPLRAPMTVLLGDARFAKRGYFEATAVRGLIEKHVAGEDHSPRLWALLWLELWFRMFVDGDLHRDDSLRSLA
jgi:asparagine synthase (glutamine-hydrolysing)